MRKGLWASVLTLAAVAGLVRADGPGSAPPAVAPPAAPALPPPTLLNAPAWPPPPVEVSNGWAEHEHHGWHDEREHFGGDTRLYGGGEFLTWWIKGYSTPPLVTTGPAASFGFLGNNGVVTLAGDRRYDDSDPYYGGRFTLGLWLLDCHACGVEGSFFFLGRRTDDAFFSSNQFPVLTIPFISAGNGQPFGEVLALPGGTRIPRDGFTTATTGNVAVNSDSEMLGTEVNLRTNLWHDARSYLDVVGGFRYVDLLESLTLNAVTTQGSSIRLVYPTAVVGTTFRVSDRFATHDQFFGGQLGVAGEFFLLDRLSVIGAAKLGLGATYESVEVQGSTLRIRGTTGTNIPGDVLAQPSNSGRFHRDPFSFLPEGLLNVGFYVTPHLRVSVGYDLLYWSRVTRPGDQIDTVIDASKAPSLAGSGAPASPTPHPVVQLRESDFWAQGITAGIEFRW
jgi:hypothetical protein